MACGGAVREAGGAHRDGRGPVAVRGVGGALEAHVGDVEFGQLPYGLGGGERGAD